MNARMPLFAKSLTKSRSWTKRQNLPDMHIISGFDEISKDSKCFDCLSSCCDENLGEGSKANH